MTSVWSADEFPVHLNMLKPQGIKTNSANKVKDQKAKPEELK
jgi:hypothetical protein